MKSRPETSVMWLPWPSAITRLNLAAREERPQPATSEIATSSVEKIGLRVNEHTWVWHAASLAGASTMGSAVPAPTPVLLGYADRFSVQAGDTIRFMGSCEATSFDARLVRLIHGDNNPAGPGYRGEPQPSPVEGTYPGQRHVIAAGSYVRVPGGG